MVELSPVLVDDKETLLIDLVVVHYVVCYNVEQKFREPSLVDVDCHDTDFCLDKHNLIMEWRDFGVNRCPVINSEESHHLRCYGHDWECSHWSDSLGTQITQAINLNLLTDF